MSGIKTAILDKQGMFAEGIIEMLKHRTDLGLTFSGIFSRATELRNHLSDHKIELLIMEISLPDIDGLDFIPQIRSNEKYMKIMVLSSYSESKFVKKALQSGADGFISKSNTFDELVVGIHEILKDRTFIAEGLHITPPARKSQTSLNGSSMSQPVYRDRFLIQKRLTRREQEILHLITQAKNNKEIAAELFISDQTVGVHRKNIMRKLGVKNTVNLIKFAMEHQLV